MKARLPPGPAKTMSRGSSQTSSVRVTRGGVVPTSTIETESERWLTTHTSELERAATARGSRPTGTEPVWVRPASEAAKISSRLSGVLTANSRVPSGDSARGRTWPVSNVVNARAIPGGQTRSAQAATRVPVAPRARNDRRTMWSPLGCGWGRLPQDLACLKPLSAEPTERAPQRSSRSRKTPSFFPRRLLSGNSIAGSAENCARAVFSGLLTHVRQDALPELPELLGAREVERQQREPVDVLAPAQLGDHLVGRPDERDRVAPEGVGREPEDGAQALRDGRGRRRRLGRRVAEDRGREAHAAGGPARPRLGGPHATELLGQPLVVELADLLQRGGPGRSEHRHHVDDVRPRARTPQDAVAAASEP